MAVKDYNTDPDLNTTISGINIAEGCPPSGINDAIRQLMADVKEEKDAGDDALEALHDRVDTTNSNLATTNSNLATTNSNLAATNSNLATTNSNLATLDAAVVHKSGDETIVGAKTFTEDVIINNDPPVLRLRNSVLQLGVASSRTKYIGISFQDKDGKDLGYARYRTYKSGGTDIQLLVNNLMGKGSAELVVGYVVGGSPYATAPSTPAGSTGNQIVTADYANATYLAKSGGTMTGVLRSSVVGGAVASDADDKDFTIFGGSAYRKGGFVKVYGKDSPSFGGSVELVADNGTNNSVFRMSPDGSAVLNDNPVLTLVASWSDGANWYRKWSDGWIEQGGLLTGNSIIRTLTFHLAFKNTNYFCIGTKDNSVETHWTPHNYPMAIAGRTATTINFCSGADMGSEIRVAWYACGF